MEKLYLDMDGVLSDFTRGIEDMCHRPCLPQGSATQAEDDEMYAAARAVGHFYGKLKPVENAIEAFHRLHKLYGNKLEILSAVPSDRYKMWDAKEDKIAWVKKYLGDDVVANIVQREEKKNYAKNKNCILIDDYQKNIDEWEAAGGTGVFFDKWLDYAIEDGQPTSIEEFTLQIPYGACGINNRVIYAITDRMYLRDGMTLDEAVERAILGGAGIIQLREKHLTGASLEELAISVQSVCKKYQVPFIVNDDVELAHKIHADGVHVGQSDMEMSKARRILGPNKIIGVTAKTVEQALAAQSAGANYLGSGAIFATSTKSDAKPLALSDFNNICESVDIPVYAIGGINSDNIDYLKGSKMSGVAVVGGVFDSDDIIATTSNLLKNYLAIAK